MALQNPRPDDQYWVDAYVTLGIWAKKGGNWSKITNVDVYVSGQVSGAGYQSLYYNQTFAVDLGPGVQAFGVTVEGGDGTLADFVAAQWTSQQASGERSATPNGQQSTIQVVPQ